LKRDSHNFYNPECAIHHRTSLKTVLPTVPGLGVLLTQFGPRRAIYVEGQIAFLVLAAVVVEHHPIGTELLGDFPIPAVVVLVALFGVGEVPKGFGALVRGLRLFPRLTVFGGVLPPVLLSSLLLPAGRRCHSCKTNTSQPEARPKGLVLVNNFSFFAESGQALKFDNNKNNNNNNRSFSTAAHKKVTATQIK
jgi:hypothetical protein